MSENIINTENKISSGFVIPDGYFDQFEYSLFEKLDKKESKIIIFYKKNKNIILQTAAVIVLSLGLYIFQFNSKDNESIAEIENHILYQSTLVDDDIVNLLDAENISKIDIENNIENQEIEDELIENSNIDIYLTN